MVECKRVYGIDQAGSKRFWPVYPTTTSYR
jgi:hypothetical protein